MPFITSANISQFRWRAVGLVVGLFMLRAVFGEYLPSMLDLALVGVATYILIWGVITFFKEFNRSVKTRGAFCVLESGVLLLACILLMSLAA